MNIGDQFKWFVGKVIDIEDPLELGRVKVRVYGNHDENVKSDDLNWAAVMLPTTSPAMAGASDTPRLEKDSNVAGFYVDADEKQFMMIIGTWPTIPEMDTNKHSLSALTRGKQTIEKSPIGPEPESAYAAKYPNNRVIQTKSGHVIEVDDTPEAERLHVYHKSGSYVEINKEGRIVIKSVTDSIIITQENQSIYVEGDMDIEVKGNINVTGDINIKGKLINNDIQFDTHIHSGVQSGSNNTQEPMS